MEHPKAIGDHTTLAVMLALQANSTPFFLPFGENTRCDVVIDEDGGSRAFSAKRDAFVKEPFASRSAACTPTTRTRRRP
jgi:hypothetical protein